MRLIDKDRLLKGTNHYLMRLDEDSIALGDIESIDVRFVEMAEEVKAIPVEWLEMFMRRYKIEGGNEYKLLHFMVTEWEKWEKENDKNI